MNDSEKSFGSEGNANPNLVSNSEPLTKKSSAESSDSPAQYYPEDDIEQHPHHHDLHRVTTIESIAEQDNISRILSGRRTMSHKPIPQMGGGRDFPPEVGDQKIYQVDFDGPDDPRHPHNWNTRRKLVICAGLAFSSLLTAWGSSVFSAGVPFAAKEFHVADVVGILGVSLYILGFASGPVIWSPLSELYGRRLPIMASFFMLICFTFACATAENLQTLLICRFFSGFTGSAPLTVVAAAFADMFGNETRGIAMCIFGGTVFCGPLAAPIISGFIAESYLGWRWTLYLSGILSSAVFVYMCFFHEETYHPVILMQKAREIRERTGNWAVFAAHERVELDLKTIVRNNMARPLVMLVTEPIITLLSIYTAFVYGILYLFLEAYPIVFVEGYGMKLGVSMLPYLGLMCGQLLGTAAMIFVFEPRYNRALAANGGKVVPEARLEPMAVGGILFPIGLFWFCWTGNYHEHVHWIVPTLSGIFTGYGLLAIFMPAINYIVESYLFFAASALAGNTFLRSSFGAAFPLFAGFMFHGMGTNWAGLFLGLFSLCLAPVPFLFIKYGKKIREKSKYAFVLN